MPASFQPLLCALLRGESPAWPAAGGDADIEAFLREARYHGVVPLLDARFREKVGSDPTSWEGRSDPGSADSSDDPGREKVGSDPTSREGGSDPGSADSSDDPGRAWPDALRRAWPEAIRDACREDALVQSMRELVHRTELVRVLAQLANAGVAPLILKGTALAYSHYADPALRPRGDTDLLIPESQILPVAAVLDRLGYARGHGVTGALISYEANWSLDTTAGITHNLDIHWRINNSQILAKLLTYDELALRATPLSAFDPHARAPCPVHALLFACMHRAGHANAPFYSDGRAYLGGDRLIWLQDIHLLVTRMSDAELTEFVALATAKQLKAICLDALCACIGRFATPVAPFVLAGLAHSGRTEPSARYLSGGRTRQMIGDFLALDGIAQRARWLKELAFPPADYMRGKYPDAANRWLPVLYARRGLDGLWKLAAGRAGGQSH